MDTTTSHGLPMMRGPAGRRAGRLVISALVLALAGCSSGKYTVNGHELQPECDGSSGPTVIFEAAVGGDHSLWPIAERVHDRANVCVYDRPGNGETPAPAAPMTARADAADLHGLIGAAHLARPVVVVGHSYGGLIAILEAVEHPDEVAGVVLIDASHPDQVRRWDALMTAAGAVAGAVQGFPVCRLPGEPR